MSQVSEKTGVEKKGVLFEKKGTRKESFLRRTESSDQSDDGDGLSASSMFKISGARTHSCSPGFAVRCQAPWSYTTRL